MYGEGGREVVVMLVVSLCVTLWAAPCVSDSGCKYTWPRTGLLKNCITEWEPSVTGQGMGCMLASATQRSPEEVATLLFRHTQCCDAGRYGCFGGSNAAGQATAVHVERSHRCERLARLASWLSWLWRGWPGSRISCVRSATCSRSSIRPASSCSKSSGVSAATATVHTATWR